jgi:hypothetical protein
MRRSPRLDYGSRPLGHKDRGLRASDILNRAFGGPPARFGTMFFASPVAAVRNGRRSLEQGSIFTMTV